MPSPLQLHGPLPPGRAGWQAAVRALATPATRLAALGPDRTPVVMSNHDPRASWFELVARPLWGLAPLAAGGGTAGDAWALLRSALAAAVDPSHDRYIGPPAGIDQRTVEAAAVGYALAVAPEQMWEPLTGAGRDHLARWLQAAFDAEVPDINWHFFPVLAGVGLSRVGIRTDRSVTDRHLRALASYALDERSSLGPTPSPAPPLPPRGLAPAPDKAPATPAWYEDGPGGRVDYYNGFGFHWYGLLYAHLTGDDRFVPAAAAFAEPFAAWFAADGAAVPYGRSLGYRFAQGAFWGALAAADVPALPWDRVRGLAQRHLEWWWRQPILDPDGGLTIGYRYPNHALVEQYLTAGSPYWGLKLFAPLALREDHPFWTSELAGPENRAVVSPQPSARAVLSRDEGGDVVRLNGQAWNPWARNGQATYGKLAYSSLAGFAVATPGPGPERAAPDGTLLLADDGQHFVGREDLRDGEVDGDTVRLAWRPWPDVQVSTVLIAAPPWHLRVHEIDTGRGLTAVEGGWCVPWAPAGFGSTDDTAWADTEGVHSLLVDLAGTRTPAVIEPMPGTHLLWPRTRLPVLQAGLAPGRHRLACAVLVGRRGVPPDAEPVARAHHQTVAAPDLAQLRARAARVSFRA